MKSARLLFIGLLAAGCGSKQINQCTQDSDCLAPYPFCDVNGEYAPSGGDKNVCTTVPANCPAERCGCTPNATTCNAGTLSVCNADAKSTTDSVCNLGCGPDNTRCATFAPSNGLSDVLAMSAGEADVVLTGQLDNLGTLFPNSVAVKSVLVSQLGAPDIRVFYARSFTFKDLVITTANLSTINPVAFVATGPIAIDGTVDAGSVIGQIHTFGPGGQPATVACAGEAKSKNSGGGGNGTKGGDGAPLSASVFIPGGAGGTAQPDLFEPLVGGCPGGDNVFDPSSPLAGGRGGAALEFASATSITIGSSGRLNYGGEGGNDGAGGASGGNALLEAPTVTINGTVTANGGSGGACGTFGNPGTMTMAPAAAIACGTFGAHSGTGGTGDQVPGPAMASPQTGAGGGGAVGRLEIKTADGQYIQGSGFLVSAKVAAGTLVRK